MPPNDSDTSIDLHGIINVIKRQLRLILVVALLVMSAAVVYLMTATPKYRSEALIIVDPRGQNILNTDASSMNGAALNSRVASELEILKSSAMALAVVQAGDLIADKEFGPRLSMKDKLMLAMGFEVASETDGGVLLKGVVNRFLDARDVRRKGLSYIIGVGVTSEDPERAALLANTLAETYIAEQVASKTGVSLSARDTIERQVVAAKARLAETEDLLDNYIFENLSRFEEETGDAELSNLRAKLEEAQRARQAQGFLATQSEVALNARDWDALSLELKDQAVSALNAQRKNLASRLAGADEASAEALDLRSALAQAEAELEARSLERIASLRSGLDSVDDQIRNMQDGIRTALFEANLSSETLAEVYTLQQEAELSRRQYQTLLSRLSELETQATVEVADSRIVSRALPPSSAAAPNKRLIVALAIVASLGLGLGLAFANEYFVGGVTSEEQLANVIGMPVIGATQQAQQEKGTLSLSDVVITQPLSGYAEAFRQLRASIDKAAHKKRREQGVAGEDASLAPVIMLTSAVPAEGKSTSALALARTYALSGKTTILLDADMRKPSVAKHLGLTPDGSIMDFLLSDNPDMVDMSFFDKDPKSNLDVVLGGGRASIPTDQLFVSQSFERFLEQARKHADVVIVDSPPLLPVVDARYIARQSDVCLLLTRFGTTPQADAREAAKQLKEAVLAGTEIFGVLSQTETKTKSYKYNGYYQDYTT